MESSRLRNRRGIGFVTPNACIKCRKKRSKCDGQTPCGRCTTLKDVECVYEVPTRQSKDEMRKEITQLRTRQRHTEEILATVAPPDVLDDFFDQLQIRDSGTLPSLRAYFESSSSTSTRGDTSVTTSSLPGRFQAISHALGPSQNASRVSPTGYAYDPFGNAVQRSSQGEQQDHHKLRPTSVLAANNPRKENRLVDMMNWASDPAQASQSSNSIIRAWKEHIANAEFGSTIQSARSRGQDVILGDRTLTGISWEDYAPKFGRDSWTTVTSDRKFVEHLLALYFCWEYPTFASLSKTHFMEDFRRGVPRYCSPLLVNAVLALGCRFSDQPSSRADPNDTTTTGDHFFAEAVKLFETEGKHRVLTTIQALGIMSIREASCGRVKEGIYLSGQSIRLAIEIGLHLDAEDNEDDGDALHDEAEEVDKAVRQATFWGAFALDEMWSLCTGGIPQFSRNSSLTVKPAILRQVEVAEWIPYTDNGGPLEQNCIQPSNIRSVYKTFCELSEIIHRTLYTFASGTGIIRNALLEVYSQYIRWFDSIPDALRLGHNFTPSVLFSHLYYHFAMFLLFRPFTEFALIDSDISPREICDQASRAISAVIKSYSGLYTLRRTPSFVPYFVFSTALFHLIELRNGISRSLSKEQLARNMSDLKNLSGCHIFAAQALDCIRFLGHKWEIDFVLGEAYDKNTRPLPQDFWTSINLLVPVIDGLPITQSEGTENATAGPGFSKGRFGEVETELKNNGLRRLCPAP